MMIHVEQHLTVEEFLASMRQRYGDLQRFRAHVRSHPRDVAAKLDLEDFEIYSGRPDLNMEEMERAVSLIPVDDRALSAFTKQRLALLDTLAGARFDSVRQLARHLGRDVHNVHADLQLFQTLGIVAIERGPRNRHVPTLAADSLRIVIEPPPSRPRGMRERERRIFGTEDVVSLDGT